MKFHIDFNSKKSPAPVQHGQNLLLLGSCFTESIGDKLRKHKFSTLENPNGILFNPVSVSEAITNYIQNRKITEADIFCYNETWHSWQHHSRFSGITAEDCLQKINTSTNNAHTFLKKADHLLITLGSAWIYRLTKNAINGKEYQVAANNHKAPADWFDKQLMDLPQTKALLGAMLQNIFAFNPGLQVIFTISPVRHLREGLIDNNRSKAVLIQAVHELVADYEQVYYFPAYELVIDDLRDYRFYAEDMVHPNYQATQYVWEKFMEASMSDATRDLIKEIAGIQLAYQHKPFNPSTNQHQQFLRSYLSKTSQLQINYPNLDFSLELGYFENELKKYQ